VNKGAAKWLDDFLKYKAEESAIIASLLQLTTTKYFEKSAVNE